jgi:exodeoxyribonuclease VII small subunit
MAKQNEPVSGMSFEEAQKALADVLQQLEENPADLEGAVALFERGKALLDQCQMLLDKAELKVSQLESNGSITPMDD